MEWWSWVKKYLEDKLYVGRAKDSFTVRKNKKNMKNKRWMLPTRYWNSLKAWFERVSFSVQCAHRVHWPSSTFQCQKAWLGRWPAVQQVNLVRSIQVWISINQFSKWWYCRIMPYSFCRAVWLPSTVPCIVTGACWPEKQHQTSGEAAWICRRPLESASTSIEV